MCVRDREGTDVISCWRVRHVHVLQQACCVFQVLADAESTATGSKGGTTVTVDTFARFHPNVNYDNITLQCCSQCKGDLQVV